MVNYFKGAFLPVVTLMDDWLAPNETDGEGIPSPSGRFYFFGFHCTAWMKFYVALAVLLTLMFAENVVEDAAYIKSEFYSPSATKPFGSFLDVVSAWDTESLSYKCLRAGAALLVTASLFVATILFETPYTLVPLQLAMVIIFFRLFTTMASTYTENISNSYEIYRDMDETLARLHHYRMRNYWYSPYMSKLELPQEYAPLIKNVFLLSGICICFTVEYFLERVMQFYSYEQVLASMNRRVTIFYLRWQFERMMAKRRSRRHRARLIRRYRNINGNFTWAGVGRDWSMHTAIPMDESTYACESFHTAILMEEDNQDKRIRVLQRKGSAVNRTC